MTAEERGKEWYIPDSQFMRSPTAKHLGEHTISNAILENNVAFSSHHDPLRMALVVKCANRPRDLPIYGLSWNT